MRMTAFGDAGTVEPAFGIDLGTTNSAISVIGNGSQPAVIRLDGKPTLPSCIMWCGGEKFVVGGEAYERRGEPNVIYSVKRLMGSGETVKLICGTEAREFQPWEISREILKALVDKAREGIYKSISDVVITVPAYFTNAQVEDTKRAGEAAGLHVLNIMHEPTAAALRYNQDLGTSSKRVLIYDLGGGTFDVSAVVISQAQITDLDEVYGLDDTGVGGTVFSVLKVAGDMRLGGDDVDAELADRAIAGLSQYGILPSDISMLERERIVLAVEKAKKLGVRMHHIPMSICGKDVVLNLVHGDFIAAYTAVYNKTKPLVRSVLNDPDVGGYVDQIITVGGCTKSPVIQGLLRNDFPGSSINAGLDPDETVAHGAAIQAKRLKFGDSTLKILDCLSMNFGVLSEDLVSVILMQGSQIPCSSTKDFYTMEPGQDVVSLNVYQGVSRFPDECTYLGTLRICGLNPPSDKHGQVFVTLAVDSDGILEITAEGSGVERQKMFLTKIYGQSSTKSPEAKPEISRWRRFAARLEEPDKQRLLEMIEQYASGQIAKTAVTSFIGGHMRKPEKDVITSVQVLPLELEDENNGQ
jgi:molecular chaperone DnaK